MFTKIPPRIGLWFTTLLWIGVFAGMWGKNHYQLVNGKEIVLNTVPISGREMLRGERLILNYEISALNLDILNQSSEQFNSHETVYVGLIERDGFWHASKIQTEPPEVGDFLRGQVKRVRGKTIEIDFGIESYFIPEGRGREIAKQYRDGHLAVVVAVNPYGKGLLKRIQFAEN